MFKKFIIEYLLNALLDLLKRPEVIQVIKDALLTTKNSKK